MEDGGLWIEDCGLRIVDKGYDTRDRDTRLMTNRKDINIQYFALFREARGLASEMLSTQAKTPRELYDELGLDAAYRFDARRLRVALNDEFASWDASLENGDSVAFIAPVAGG